MRRLGWIWLTSWFALSATWCVTAGRELGPTVDEPFYMEVGLKSWSRWEHNRILDAGTMPLPVKVVALPLFLAEVFRGTPLDSDAGLYDWLPLARLGTLVFWGLLLLAGYLGGRLWGGETAAWLAVAFLAVEPVLLGHACLAATDLAFTAVYLLFIVGLKAGKEQSFTRRILVPAVLCGLTLLTKVSALLFIPIAMAAVDVEHLWQRWRLREGINWKRSLRDSLQIGLGGVMLAFILCPETMRAVRYQVRHNAGGHGQIFLLGESSPSGFWYYFPAALVIKTSLPILLLLALFLARPRYLATAPLLAALGLVLLSPAFRVQIGIRFVLPVVALAILGLAVALAKWLADCQSPLRMRLTWGVIGLALAWTVFEAVSVWPHGLCYTNRLFGGTPRGYLALSDSNYDWGQGLPELARWQQRHDSVPLDVCYFGSDIRAKQPPFRSVEFGHITSLEELRRTYRGHYLAVSTSMLYGVLHATPGAKILRELTPVDRTTTFLIYDFTDHAGATKE